jgi:hypothetical protein
MTRPRTSKIGKRNFFLKARDDEILARAFARSDAVGGIVTP